MMLLIEKMMIKMTMMTKVTKYYQFHLILCLRQLPAAGPGKENGDKQKKIPAISAKTIVLWMDICNI